MIVEEIREYSENIRFKDVQQNQCYAIGSIDQREKENSRVNRVVAKQGSSRWLLDLFLYSFSLSLFFFFTRARKRTRPAYNVTSSLVYLILRHEQVNVFNESRRYSPSKGEGWIRYWGRVIGKISGGFARLLAAPMLAELIIERLIDEFSTTRYKYYRG